jgi:SHS2 domain-containing protein
MTGNKPYVILNHTADLGLLVTGRTIEDVFANAAAALTDLMIGTNAVKQITRRGLDVDGIDRDDLWVNFLREILSLLTSKTYAVKSCQILRMEANQLTAELRGEPYDVVRHVVKTEIKAITYHQAVVRRTRDGWEGKVICDV